MPSVRAASTKTATKYNPGITTNNHGKMYATAVIA
jgi:hypothetical protein